MHNAFDHWMDREHLHRSELDSFVMRITEHLVGWAMQKFKRLRNQPTGAWVWLDAVPQHQPRLSAH